MTLAATSGATQTALGTSTLLLMAVATGLCAGSNYFNQPLLHSMASSLHVSDATAALTVTLSQLAYATGLLLFVPLGDKLERRSLTVGLMLLAALGLLLSGFATSFAMLVAGTVITGLFSVAAQTLVPMAAALAEPRSCGRAVGIVMSGLLGGILVARSAAGLLSDIGGWNTVYRIAALLMAGVAAVLWRALPRSRNPTPLKYRSILRSLVTLAARHRRLRSRSLLGALSFASASVLFSSTTLLLSGPAFGMSDSGIGLVGLLGAAGAMVAGITGRLADRGWGQATSALGVFLLLLGWACLSMGGTELAWLIAGTLSIDIALAGLHISNQSVIYQLAPAARARLNAVYMTCYFAGAAAGSALASAAWRIGGWDGVCATGAGLAALSKCALVYDQLLSRRAADGG
jgi:predicted MFS family arabinose efflux permease